MIRLGNFLRLTVGLAAISGGYFVGGVVNAFASSSPTHLVSCYTTIGGSESSCYNPFSIVDDPTGDKWTATNTDYWSSANSASEYLDTSSQTFSVTQGNPYYIEYYAYDVNDTTTFYDTTLYDQPLIDYGSHTVSVNKTFPTDGYNVIYTGLVTENGPAAGCNTFGCDQYQNVNHLNN